MHHYNSEKSATVEFLFPIFFCFFFLILRIKFNIKLIYFGPDIKFIFGKINFFWIFEIVAKLNFLQIK